MKIKPRERNVFHDFSQNVGTKKLKVARLGFEDREQIPKFILKLFLDITAVISARVQHLLFTSKVKS